MKFSMHWLVMHALYFSLACAEGARSGAAFVGLDDNDNLALQPPTGRQIIADGVALIEELADLRALIAQQQSTIAQLKGTALAGLGRLLWATNVSGCTVYTPADQARRTTVLVVLGGGGSGGGNGGTLTGSPGGPTNATLQFPTTVPPSVPFAQAMGGGSSSAGFSTSVADVRFGAGSPGGRAVESRWCNNCIGASSGAVGGSCRGCISCAANTCCSSDSKLGNDGVPGGYVATNFDLEPGQTLKICVGKGGAGAIYEPWPYCYTAPSGRPGVDGFAAIYAVS